MFLNDDKEFVRIAYDFFVNADKRTYAAIGIALFVAFLYFGAFFRNASGFNDDLDKSADVPVLDKDYDPVESQWSDTKISGSPYQVRIVGRDADHNPVTDVSNVLILNLPPVTNIVLNYDPEDGFMLSWTYDGGPPDGWQVQYQAEGTTDWTLTADLLPGITSHSFEFGFPTLARVYATKTGMGIIGDPSNEVAVG